MELLLLLTLMNIFLFFLLSPSVILPWIWKCFDSFITHHPHTLPLKHNGHYFKSFMLLSSLILTWGFSGFFFFFFFLHFCCCCFDLEGSCYVLVCFGGAREWLHRTSCGISVHWLRMEPRPQQWKPRVLVTRPPRNSPHLHYYCHSSSSPLWTESFHNVYFL